MVTLVQITSMGGKQKVILITHSYVSIYPWNYADRYLYVVSFGSILDLSA